MPISGNNIPRTTKMRKDERKGKMGLNFKIIFLVAFFRQNKALPNPEKKKSPVNDVTRLGKGGATSFVTV
jgi:hypothetical protein